jgi:cytochrome c553
MRSMSKVLAGVVLAAALLVPGLVAAAEKSRRELEAALNARPDLAHGAVLFQACASCHGTTGNGMDDGSVPRIAGQHFRVLVRQLVDYRYELRWDIRMEHYAGRGLLKDARSIADVSAYVSQLARDAPRNVGDGSLLRHGALIYRERCAECHGEAGQGDGRAFTPRLAGQHYAYLLRQMYDGVDGRRPNCSAGHVRIFARLQHDDFAGLADYLSRSEWTGPREALALER